VKQASKSDEKKHDVVYTRRRNAAFRSTHGENVSRIYTYIRTYIHTKLYSAKIVKTNESEAPTVLSNLSVLWEISVPWHGCSVGSIRTERIMAKLSVSKGAFRANDLNCTDPN